MHMAVQGQIRFDTLDHLCGEALWFRAHIRAIAVVRSHREHIFRSSSQIGHFTACLRPIVYVSHQSGGVHHGHCIPCDSLCVFGGGPPGEFNAVVAALSVRHDVQRLEYNRSSFVGLHQAPNR